MGLLRFSIIRRSRCRSRDGMELLADWIDLSRGNVTQRARGAWAYTSGPPPSADSLVPQRGASHAALYLKNVPNIADLEAKRDVRGLIKVLSGKKDKIFGHRWQIAAAQALGRLHDKRAMKPLLAVLQQDDWEMRWEASKALVQLGDPAAIEPLITLLRRSRSDDTVGSAAETLGGFGDRRAVEPLIALLTDKRRVKAFSKAAEALGQLGDQRAVEPLIKMLDVLEEHLSIYAVMSLGKLGDRRAVEPLIQLLGHHDSTYNANVISALDKLGDPRATEPLIMALRDNRVTGAVVPIIVKLGGQQAVEPLIAALEDPRGGYPASYAAQALGILKDGRATDPLIAALQHRDESVRKAAASALLQLGDVRAVQPLVAAVRNNVASPNLIATLAALGGPGIVPALVDALQTGSQEVRLAVIEALGTVDPTQASGPLIAYALKDPEAPVRKAGIKLLGKLGDLQAVDPLNVLVGQDPDPYVRNVAADNLGLLGDKRSVQALIAALSDQYWYVCKAAATALGLIGDMRAIDSLATILVSNGPHDRVNPGTPLPVEGRVYMHEREPGRVYGVMQSGITGYPAEELAEVSQALQLIIRRNKTEMSDKDLRRIAGLRSSIPAYVTHSEDLHTERHPVLFDCLPLIETARQALIRRGPPA